MKPFLIVIALATLSLLASMSALPNAAGQASLSDRLKNAMEKTEKEKAKTAAPSTAKKAGQATAPASGNKFQSRGRGVGATTTKVPDPAKVGKKGSQASKVIGNDPTSVGKSASATQTKKGFDDVYLFAKAITATRYGDQLNVVGQISTSAGAKLKLEPSSGRWAIYRANQGQGSASWGEPIASGDVRLLPGEVKTVPQPHVTVTSTSATMFKLKVVSNDKTTSQEYLAKAAPPLKFVVRYRCVNWTEGGKWYAEDTDQFIAISDEYERRKTELQALGFQARYVYKSEGNILDRDTELRLEFRAVDWQEGVHDTLEGAEGFRKSLPRGCESEVITREGA